MGSLRTAIFSWALARSLDGEFLIRIEDTDAARNAPEMARLMLEALEWIGLEWDEGPDIGGPYAPYVQSERLARHQEVAKTLLESGQAYYGDDPEAPAEAGDNPLRLRLQDKDIVIEDALRGPLTFSMAERPDPVLVRTDGKPLYHLATIVDDHDQAITHVVRGEEWLSSLPIHAYLYRLLGWPEPVWVHLPLVLNQERQRLSKRDPEGGYLVQDFQEAGYLPAALFNYLLLLGWSPDGEQEIISKWEARRQFRLERLNKAAAIFDWDKAKWVNRQYMKKLSNSELAQQIHPHLEDWYESLPASDDWLLRLAALIREEISLFSEAPAAASWAFEAGFEYTDAANKSLSDEAARPVLIRLIAELAQLVLLDTSTADRILKRMRQDFKELAGLSASQVMQPLRAALTGKLDGPPLPEIMALLGSARCMERLASAHKRATV